ncbi:MAG: phosphodiester glycosidase family protein, partial [Candidatus Omnitrophota bacterium]
QVLSEEDIDDLGKDLIDKGYIYVKQDEITRECDDPSKMRGEYCICRDGAKKPYLKIRFKRGVYPCTIVGKDSKGNLAVVTVAGKSGEEGITFEGAQRKLRELGIESAVMLDSGADAIMNIKGNMVIPSCSDRKRFLSLLIFAKKKARETVKTAKDIVGNLVVLSRRAEKEADTKAAARNQCAATSEKKLIIGIETGWIPGYGENGMQYNELFGLINSIKELEAKLRGAGIKNLELVCANGDELADKLSEAVGGTVTGNLENIIVLASKKTLERPKFRELRSTDSKMKAFFGIIDTRKIRRYYGGIEEEDFSGMPNSIDPETFFKMLRKNGYIDKNDFLTGKTESMIENLRGYLNGLDKIDKAGLQESGGVEDVSSKLYNILMGILEEKNTSIDSDTQCEIEIFRMLSITLGLAVEGRKINDYLGEDIIARDGNGRAEYNRQLRKVVFLPEAKPVKCGNLREKYKTESAALEAA